MNVRVMRNVFERNDAVADVLRTLTESHHVTIINMIGSPGCGKTTLLERLLPSLRDRYRVAVLEGDIATTRDAQRIDALDVPVIQLVTGGACHLEAPLVYEAAKQLPLADLDLIFVENVGNLVCPASFDIGENKRITVYSVTEGDDKPAKYPGVFRKADAVVITKTDLLGWTDFDRDAAVEDIRHVNPHAPIIEFSYRDEMDCHPLCDWIEQIAGAVGKPSYSAG